MQELGSPSALYLKEECYYDNTTWYKCPNSPAEYYTTLSSYGVCYVHAFDHACSADPYFYQSCGHGQCAGGALLKHFLRKLSSIAKLLRGQGGVPDLWMA